MSLLAGEPTSPREWEGGELQGMFGLVSSSYVARGRNLLGYPIVRSDELPIPISPGEEGKRIARTGLAGILIALGEKPGPKPDELVHMIKSNGMLLVSPQLMDHMTRTYR